MKLHTNKHSFLQHRLLFIVAGLVTVLCIGLAFYSQQRHNETTSLSDSSTTDAVNPPNTVDYSPATDSDNQANEDRKSDPSNAAPTLNNGSRKPESKTSLAITITRAGKNQSGDNLQVATIIEGTSSGSCTITASKSGETSITRRVNVEQQANSYVCPVVNIPLTEFSANGSWNISASVTDDGQTKSTDWAANPVSI